MKSLLGFLLLFFLSVSSAQQTLIIGTGAQNPPFSSIANKEGDFFGFDIDIMLEICKRIKATCQFTAVHFPDVFTDLQAGKINLVIAGVIRTPDQLQQFLFSIPYLTSSGQFLALEQSKINVPEDIKDKTVGVRSGTPFKSEALILYNNQVKIKEYPPMSALFEALNKGDVDVIFIDEAAARYWYANNSNLYKLIGIKIPVGNGYAIMANPNENSLVTKINQAILNMGADGTYLKIYTQYFSN